MISKPKTTYRFTLPDGKKVTRTSHKPYAYVVVVRSQPGGYWDSMGWPWGVYRWSQTEQAAQNGAKEAYRTGAYPEVLIRKLDKES